MHIRDIETTRRVISLNIKTIKYSQALQNIIELANINQPSYVCFANVHMTIEGSGNPIFAEQVNRATLVLADGMPIVKSLKLLYGVSQERIAGMDIFPDLLKKANELRLSVFFFGSTNEVLQKITERVRREFTDLNIAGSLSPPFSQSINSSNYVNIINNSNANFVFVALGCPKQEIWMAKNSKYINATLLGVGGAFSVYAGLTKRAPRWMRDYALEWLYRLIQEPGRMWKRYFFTNSMFIMLICKALTLKFFGFSKTNSYDER